jgi:hypothetical protein
LEVPQISPDYADDLQFSEMMRSLIMFSFCLLCLTTSAQDKLEREQRVTREAVPEPARAFIDSLDFEIHTRWYREIGLNRSSYEAKFKRDGERYSIEFLPDGTLEDAEIEVDWESLPESTSTRIESFLNQRFSKFKLERIQIQYSGAPEEVLRYLKRKTGSPTVAYECVVAAKINGEFGRMEFLFSAEGELKLEQKIIAPSTDNIEY